MGQLIGTGHMGHGSVSTCDIRPTIKFVKFQEYRFNYYIIIIIIIEFIVHLSQCGHGHRYITLSIKPKKLVNNKNNKELYHCAKRNVLSLCLKDVV